MVAEVAWWLKLWWKGVDIAASIISSTASAVMIAVVARITWNWKKKRDLKFEADKQRQQAEIAAELQRQDVLRDRRQKLRRLEAEHRGFVIESGVSHFDFEGFARHFLSWLERERLDKMLSNRATAALLREVFTLENARPEVKLNPERLHIKVREVELPDAEDDTFHW